MNSTHAEILGQLESRTAAFRYGLADRHMRKGAEARRAYGAAVDAWAEALAAELGEKAPRPRSGPDGLAALSLRRKRAVKKVQADPFKLDARREELLRSYGFAPRNVPSLEPKTVREELPPEIAELRAAVGSMRWHQQRATGQEGRFARVRNCGGRVRVTACGYCGKDGRVMPDGCKVGRLCGACTIAGAKRRRSRFGRARARALLESRKVGLTRHTRRGGRYTEKMLTLTVPHVTREELERRGLEAAAEACDATKTHRARKRAAGRSVAALELAKLGTVKARVELLWRAWPLFRRRLVEHLELRNEHERSCSHRAFEWTPGSDSLGHPHFHVWLWCPFLDRVLISRMWTEAILDVGSTVPRTNDGLARVQIQVFRDFNGAAMEELLKGGKREALTLSRLYHGQGPRSAFEYADGWTLADVFASAAAPATIAELYEALEGKRLTQGSRGFFVDDEPAKCPCCEGLGELRVRFMHRQELEGRRVDPRTYGEERGPP